MISYQAAALLHLDATLVEHWIESTTRGTDIVACRLDIGTRIRIEADDTAGELVVHRADPAGFPTGEYAVLRDCPDLVGLVIDALLRESPAQASSC